MSPIDTTFDFRSDTPPKKDPDTWSPTLCRYHKLLWSKALPTGERFELHHKAAPFYLHHSSDLGEFWMSSDAVVPTFRKQKALASIFEQMPEDLRIFNCLGYTIGGMMIFPANRVGRKMTINGARGFRSQIADRFDYTVECIRRHYSGDESPLSEVLGRYSDFFGLFQNFRGYVEFFLLQDLVDQDCSTVRFFSPFDDFNSAPVPKNLVSYLEYRTAAMAFLEARNKRIHEWAKAHLNS